MSGTAAYTEKRIQKSALKARLNEIMDSLLNSFRNFIKSALHSPCFTSEEAVEEREPGTRLPSAAALHHRVAAGFQENVESVTCRPFDVPDPSSPSFDKRLLQHPPTYIKVLP